MTGDTNGSDTVVRTDIIDITFVFMFLAISNRIRLNIDVINMQFEHSDTNMISDVEYPDSDRERCKLL